MKKNKKLTEAVLSSREMILANLSMLSQIPAQTFHESKRAQFILQRFTESGVPEVKTDKMHNAFGIYNGKKNKPTVMIFCHMDNQFDRSVDQNISISENRAYGAGIADDNIALAVLLTLPDVLRMASLDPDCNLILLATTRSHGRGDFEGIRQFIKDGNYKIDSAINLSGLTLGTMNYFTRSRFRCDINCKVAVMNEHSQINIPTGHAILTINEIIDNILKIPLPQKPWTNMNIGIIKGGERYSTPSREASIQLEALSEDDQILEKLKDEIQSMIVDVGAKHGSIVSTDFFGTLKKSEITSRHPLVRHSIDILNELGYTPKMEYVNSEIAVTLSENIPSVSLGITTGLGGSSSESYIDISPISEGVVQLLNLITRISKDNQFQQCC
jgi:tripeptide aminopeptidase